VLQFSMRFRMLFNLMKWRKKWRYSQNVLFFHSVQEVWRTWGTDGTISSQYAQLRHVITQALLVSERRGMMNELCCYALPVGIHNNVNVTQNMYRPGETMRFPGSTGSWISFQSAHAGGNFVGPTHRPPLSLRKYSWYLFVLESKLSPGP